MRKRKARRNVLMMKKVISTVSMISLQMKAVFLNDQINIHSHIAYLCDYKTTKISFFGRKPENRYLNTFSWV